MGHLSWPRALTTLTSICGSTAGRALLVDDDEVVRRNVRQALEPIGSTTGILSAPDM